jgi:hypothetical protein
MQLVAVLAKLDVKAAQAYVGWEWIAGGDISWKSP